MPTKSPTYLSPEWWAQIFGDAPQPPGYAEMIAAFHEWEARAGREAHAALEQASAAAEAASAAREKTLRAYNKKMLGGATRALEAYDSLLKARAGQYLGALERYKAQVDAIDAAAAKTAEDANRMRKAMKTIRQNLDEATATTEEAVAAQSEMRIAEAMKLTEALEHRTNAAISLWENGLRELNSVMLGRLAMAATRPAGEAPAPEIDASAPKKGKAKSG